MWDWLLLPIDTARPHEVGLAVSWHGRSMTLAWGVLAPLAVVMARFLKVLPGQDWPRDLDAQFWWRCHWIGQSVVLGLSVLGIGLVVGAITTISGGWHGVLGYTVLALAVSQIALGLARGSKGGPTATHADGSWRGDHYDMTPWRRRFEHIHKGTGYLLLMLGAVTILFGLWQANGARWMWLGLLGWWVGLALLAVYLQRRGWAIDTYQAIWGPDEEHPGNRLPAQGWGMRRASEASPPPQARAAQTRPHRLGETVVRSD